MKQVLALVVFFLAGCSNLKIDLSYKNDAAKSDQLTASVAIPDKAVAQATAAVQAGVAVDQSAKAMKQAIDALLDTVKAPVGE